MVYLVFAGIYSVFTASSLPFRNWEVMENTDGSMDHYSADLVLPSGPCC